MMEDRMLRARRLAMAALLLAAGRVAAAQEFQPPRGPQGSESGGFRLDLLGFSTRVGGEVSSGGAFVLGTTVDIAQLWSPQVRLRPSFEYSGSGGTSAVHVAAEVVYRFQPDRAPAIPYVGAGIGYYRETGGGQEKVWPTISMGFELEFRPSFNWLLEYHALDRLGRHRFLIGLATRGGV